MVKVEWRVEGGGWKVEGGRLEGSRNKGRDLGDDGRGMALLGMV